MEQLPVGEQSTQNKGKNPNSSMQIWDRSSPGMIILKTQDFLAQHQRRDIFVLRKCSVSEGRARLKCSAFPNTRQILESLASLHQLIIKGPNIHSLLCPSCIMACK